MWNAKALRFDHWGVKQARKHEVLVGKKPIGRGTFSAVFDGTRKNTVLKMTVDDSAYWLLNDWAVCVNHWHFPRVVKNYGEIGNTRIGRFDFPIYLYEIERLEKVSGPNKRLVNLICGAEDNSRRMAMGKNWEERPKAAKVLDLMLEDKALPRTIHNALRQLRNFADHMDGSLDLHSGNFLQRANGELVMSDPIANMKIWDEARRQLARRGW